MRSVLCRFPAALAILLWLGATLFYLGDTGRYSDDHAAHLRTPLSGDIDWSRHPWQRWEYFWRPLHLAHCTIINTVSWNHAWIGHLELALIQAAVGWLLRSLLIRLGIRSPIATVAALLFVLCPLTAEAALWTSASCNAISTLLLLLALELTWRHAAQPRDARDRFRVPLIAALGFIIPCWYEPAAAALAAVPIVFLAACPASQPWRIRLRRSAAPTFLCAISCAAYLALLLATAPAHTRGSLPSLATPRELPQRCTLLAHALQDLAVGPRGHDILCGSIQQGWHALHSPIGYAWLAAITFLACVAGIAWITGPKHHHLHASPATPPPGSLLAIGSTISIASLLPVLISDAPGIDLRTLYVPLLGFTCILAGLANGAAALTERWNTSARTTFNLGASCFALAAALLSAIGMIGFQTNFRTIDRNDQRILAQLRDAFPNPPPGTTFLPLAIACRGARTGYPLYDHALHGGLELPSHATTMLRFALRRPDVSCVGLTFRLNGRVPINTLGPSGFHIARTRAGALSPTRVPWETTIPFIVDASGSVSFVDSLSIRDQSGMTHQTRPAQTNALSSDHPRAAVELVENPDGRTSIHIVNNPHTD